MFTNSVFTVWRLSCSEIASSNWCSKDFAFSLAEWAVPSRSSTWRRTVNTGFFTVCPGKESNWVHALMHRKLQMCFCSQGSDKPPLNFCNSGFAWASCARALSTALTVLLCQVASFCRVASFRSRLLTPPLLQRPLYFLRTLLVSRDWTSQFLFGVFFSVVVPSPFLSHGFKDIWGGFP